MKTPAQGNTSRILVVDDDATVRFLAREALEGHGYVVEEAPGADEAITAFRESHPSMVLMDVLMPGRDGFSACSELRMASGGETVPIILMTGLEDVDSINKAYEVGATDFISKPFNAVLLAHRVRYILRASAWLQRLSRSESVLAHAQRLASIGNWELDVTSNQMQGSTEFFRILGLGPQPVGFQREVFLELVHPDDRDTVIRAIAASGEGLPLTLDHRICRVDGEERCVHFQGQLDVDVLRREGRIFGTIQDITDRKTAEKRIQFLACHDSLTLLPNVALFRDRLAQAIRTAQRHKEFLAVMFLDLDRFKRINDSLGHAFGDALLKEVATRLNSVVRGADTARLPTQDDGAESAQVGRLGGDEFAVLLTRIKYAEDAAKVAERILKAVAQPIKIHGREVFTTASIGISLYPSDCQDMEALLKSADTAMYEAKASGKNNYRYYSKATNKLALERLAMESSLHKAIERREFLLYYQPRVNLVTGKGLGLEALLRWRHPELGLLEPATFAQAAQDSGLLRRIDTWGLQEACSQIRAWESGVANLTSVGINLSNQFFHQESFVSLVASMLGQTQVSPDKIELELTEAVVMNDIAECVTKVRSLMDMGVICTMDDFGTGYSSFGHLRDLPFSKLKIDGSFIRDLTTCPRAQAIVKSFIALAHGLDLRVVAEGVETSQQLKYLKSHGCDEAQGYWISRPLSAASVAELLKKPFDLDEHLKHREASVEALDPVEMGVS